LRLADFFGFVGLMSEILRIRSSNRDGWFFSFIFTAGNHSGIFTDVQSAKQQCLTRFFRSNKKVCAEVSK